MWKPACKTVVSKAVTRLSWWRSSFPRVARNLSSSDYMPMPRSLVHWRARPPTGAPLEGLGGRSSRRGVRARAPTGRLPFLEHGLARRSRGRCGACSWCCSRRGIVLDVASVHGNIRDRRRQKSAESADQPGAIFLTRFRSFEPLGSKTKLWRLNMAQHILDLIHFGSREIFAGGVNEEKRIKDRGWFGKRSSARRPLAAHARLVSVAHPSSPAEIPR